MDRLRTSSPLRGSLSVPLLAIAVACGGAPDRPAMREPAALELRPLGPPRERSPVRRVHRFLPTDRGAQWTVKAADEHELVACDAVEPGGKALLLSSERPALVRIERALHPEDFNQVAIRLATPKRVKIALDLCRSSGVERRIAKVELSSTDEPTTLFFELPAPRSKVGQEESATVEALEIAILSPAKRLEIASVDLLFEPWEHWLPDASSQPELVILDDEGRRAVGLVQGRPLGCDLRAPEGGRLAFSYAMPGFLPRVNGRVDVVLELFDGARCVGRKNSTLGPAKSGRDAGWNHASIDLEEWAGRSLRAVFSVSAPDGSGAICALTSPHVLRPGIAAPTVVLVTSDTHRADHLGCAPDTAGVQTPTLDALAASGVLFEDCFSQANATRPSHAALLTAMHPRDHGLTDNVSRLSDRATTLAERFRAAGYLTFAAVSATPVSPVDSGLAQGFERYSYSMDQERRSQQAIADVLSWLPDAEGVPLFVWLHVFDAHAPYAPPADLAELYVPQMAAGDGEQRTLPEDLRLSWKPKVRELSHIVASYMAEVTSLDRELAEFFSHPRLAGAITAFTADHGESLTAHDIWFTHSGLYTDTVRVPLILRWPGGPAGERVGRPVQQMDVGRTLLDLAGLHDVDFPGSDLMAEDAFALPRFTLSANGWSAAITHAQWHLILHLRERKLEEDGQVLSGRRRHQTELYHLAQDPRCERDLVVERADQARKLRAMLVEWLLAAPAETLSERPEVADAESMEELEALGYVTDVDSEDSNAWWDPACVCAECKSFE